VLHVFSASYLSFVIAPTPAILIGKLFSKRVLLNYHSGEAEDHLTRWRRTAIPIIRLADLVVVPSEYLVRVFARFGLEAHAIHNLVDTGRFRFRERKVLQPVFLSNRNLESHYGVDHVMRAFAIIQQSYPAASLTIAGDGSQRVSLERLSKELKLQNTVFVGKIDPNSIADLYDRSDIYLNGSEIDNQPLSILEAFACGLPIVTTAAGGIPDIVSNGRTGFVVPCRDHEQMAVRAIELLSQPNLAREMTTRAVAECRLFSWEAVRDGWLSSYQQLSPKKTAPPSNRKQVTEKGSNPDPDVVIR
jgi:glycosyltransferase involved in cell wall biosynthesis